MVEYQIVALKVIGSIPVIYPEMYNLILNFKKIDTLNNKNNKLKYIEKKYVSSIKILSNRNRYKNILTPIILKYDNLKMFNFAKTFNEFIFINKISLNQIAFLIMNQNTSNLKLNVFSKKLNFFFSTGILLVILNIFKKKSRKSIKSYRLLFNYILRKFFTKFININLFYVLLKNSKKNSFVITYIVKYLKITNFVLYYKTNTMINTKIKPKRSIKKKTKKKIIWKNNLIV